MLALSLLCAAPRVRRVAALAAAAALVALAGCGGPPPLALVPAPVPVGYDNEEVRDVALVDPDHDGQVDLVVATDQRLRYLHRADGRWTEATPGTALEKVAAVDRLEKDGDDLLAARGATLVRLVSSGIGSWHEAAAPVPASLPPPPLTVDADLNGDGAIDRASLKGRQVRVALREVTGALRDVTTDVGADGLMLRGDGSRIAAVDLDADGDTDLLAVGSRILVLINNGGRFDFGVKANMGEGAVLPAPMPTSAPHASAAGGGAPVAAAAQGATPAAASAAAASAAGAWFTDVTAAAGIAFRHHEGEEQWDIRPTMGPGVAWADVDGDGDEDLYVVGGTGQLGRLFLNAADGTFADGTEAEGLAAGPRATGAGMGCSFADWDNDGDPDLFVTRDGGNVMWRNDAGRFTDITESAGTGGGRWAAGAAWADIDRDGDLDLFVTNYLKFDASLLPADGTADGAARGGAAGTLASQRREDPLAMLPYVFPAETSELYRNDGGGRFTDISAAAGITAATGKGMGVAFFDEDGDGWPDAYVANDTTPNHLWRNKGSWGAGAGSDAGTVGGFEEIALFIGLDDPRGGMGVELADVDGDGDEDIFTSYWQTEPNGLYRNNMLHLPTTRKFVPRFEDVALAAGLAQPSVGVVGWGCVLDDLDDDGDDDLFVANGYTSPDYETTMQCVGQLNHLYENVTAPGSLKTHRDVPHWVLLPPEKAGAHFKEAWAWRGAAAADYDGDGDLDLAVTANNGPLVLLRNERGGAGGGNAVRVVCRGNGTSCNRDAVGARVTLTLEDGSRRVRFVRRGSSYLSGHAPGVRFGLGGGRPVSLTVDWPDGRQTTRSVSAGGDVLIEE